MIYLKIDNWHRRIEKHKWDGHQIIKYPEPKKLVDTEQSSLLFKEKMLSLKKKNTIPTTNKLSWWEREEET